MLHRCAQVAHAQIVDGAEGSQHVGCSKREVDDAWIIAIEGYDHTRRGCGQVYATGANACRRGRFFRRDRNRLNDRHGRIHEQRLELVDAPGGVELAQERHGAGYDPRVRFRIERGAAMKAWEYLDLFRARREWIARVEQSLQGFDAVLSPTVPIVAPPIAEVAPATGADAAADEARDKEFFRVNALLLRNTSVVNMLDGCALSIPCQARGELPVGLMIWHGPLRDDTVLNIGLRAQDVLAGRSGAA